MKTREIQKAMGKLIVDMNKYFNTSFVINRVTYRYRDNKGKFYVKYRLELVKLDHQFWNVIEIWAIYDIKSTDISFEKLKPQIKKILWEHFWFWWRVRNLFR